MFDDEINEYCQTQKRRAFQKETYITEKEECNFVTTVLMGIETVQNLKK